MRPNILFLIVSLSLLHIATPNAFTRLLSQYTTDPQRTETVSKACDGKSRNDLFKLSQDFDNSAVTETIESSFPQFDAPGLIQKMVTGKLTNDQALKQIRTHTNGIVVTFIFYVIPILVMIFLLPALCCCCACPDTCPCSDCCRQKSFEPYTKAQYSCPAIFIIIFSTFIIVTGIIAFAWRQSIQTTYNDVRCSTAIIFDDFLNGNVTRSGNEFFIGVQTLGRQLSFMSDNIDELGNDLQAIGTDGPKTKQLYSDMDDAMTSSEEIPDGTAGNSLTLTYPSPLNENNPNSTVSSSFPSVLGTKNDMDTLIYDEVNGLNLAKSSLMLVSAAADVFSAALSGFKIGVNASAVTVNNLATSLNDVDNDIVNTTFELVQTNFVNIAVIVFYVLVGILVLCAVLTWLSSCCLLCFDKSSCRYLLYTGCTCLSLMAFICFLVAIVFAAITPVSYFSCKFIETSLNSKVEFEENFGPILNNEDVTTYISECLPSSSGNIIQKLVGQDIYTSMTSLGDTTEQLMNFNLDATIKLIDDGYQHVTPTIEKYLTAQILDISDKSALQKISDPNQYTCGASGFASDSWIPSIAQNSVACNVNGANVTSATCPTTADFQSSATGCFGCIDTYSIFSGNSSNSSILDSLNNRYSGCGGSDTSFNQELTNVWTNFYSVKENQIGPVHSRSETTDTLIEGVKTSINDDIAGLFDDTLAKLQDEFSTLVDPKYGIIAGFNCKVIGEDIQLFFTYFCYDTIVMSFFIQVALGVIGYLALFIACCAVCLGVRHNRKEEDNERQKTYGYKEDYGSRPESGQGFY